MHATIRVSQCLRNQRKTDKFNPLAYGGGNIWNSLRYPGCKGCDQGALAARGELSDEDVTAMIEQIKNKEIREMEQQTGAVNIEAIPDEYTCQDCGCKFGPWKLGDRATIRTRCKPCHYKRNGKSISKAVAGIARLNRRKPATPVEKADNRQHIVIDFTTHPHLLEAIRNLAREQYRLPEQQILYMIDRTCFEEEAS